MISGIHSAAAAMEQAEARHELIARNLAHVDMPGFRRGTMVTGASFADSLHEAGQGQSTSAGSSAPTARESVDFSPGRLMQTGNVLDVALAGDGFFVVNVNGESLYTRNGSFQLDAEGQLVTADGHPVVGESGPLRLANDAALSRLRITPDGTATVDGAEIGQLRIASFEDVHQLTPAGVTLFRAPEGIAAVESSAAVMQGARESSNVNPVHELVDMIATSRAHESAQRAMNAIAQALQRHTDLRGT